MVMTAMAELNSTALAISTVSLFEFRLPCLVATLMIYVLAVWQSLWIKLATMVSWSLSDVQYSFTCLDW